MGTYDDLMLLLRDGHDSRTPRSSGFADPWRPAATVAGAEIETTVGTLSRVADGVWIELRRRGEECREAERRVDEIRREKWSERLPEPFRYRLPDLSRLRAELAANDVSYDETVGRRAAPRPTTEETEWRLHPPAGAMAEVDRYYRSTDASLKELRRSADAAVHQARLEIQRVTDSLHELFALLESLDRGSSRDAYARVLRQLADEGVALDASRESWEDGLRQWVRRCRTFEDGRAHRVQEATAQAFLQTRAYAVVLARPDAAPLPDLIFNDMYRLHTHPREPLTPRAGWAGRVAFSRDEWIIPGASVLLGFVIALALSAANGDGSVVPAVLLAAAVTAAGTLALERWAYRRALTNTLTSDYCVVRSTDPRFDAVIALEAMAHSLDDRIRGVQRLCPVLPEQFTSFGQTVRRLAWEAARETSLTTDHSKFRVAARQARALNLVFESELDDLRFSLESSKADRLEPHESAVWSQLVHIGDQFRAQLDAVREVLHLERRSVDTVRPPIEHADSSGAGESST